MLTGDSSAVAAAIGAQLGVDDVRAELLPDQKLAAVRVLAATGLSTSAPALAVVLTGAFALTRLPAPAIGSLIWRVAPARLPAAVGLPPSVLTVRV